MACLLLKHGREGVVCMVCKIEVIVLLVVIVCLLIGLVHSLLLFL